MRKYIAREEVKRLLKKHQYKDCDNLGMMDPETGSRECTLRECQCEIENELIDQLLADLENLK